MTDRSFVSVTVHLSPAQLDRLEAAGLELGEAAIAEQLVVAYEDRVRLERVRPQLIERAEKAEANYAFMVRRAVDQGLDGYRELGARCAKLEAERDRLLACMRQAGLAAFFKGGGQPAEVGDHLRSVLASYTDRIEELEALVRWLCLHVEVLSTVPWTDDIPEDVQEWLVMHQPRMQGTTNVLAVANVAKTWSKEGGPKAVAALRRLGREALQALREAKE